MLKTLQDFKMWGTCGCTGQEGLTVEVWRLKQGAIKDVKEFIKLLKEEDEDYEAKIVGLVWGLNSQEPFDSKIFNNKFNELRIQQYKEHPPDEPKGYVLAFEA